MAGEARSAYPLRIIYASERLGSEGFNRCRHAALTCGGTRLGPLGRSGAPLGLSCMWMEAEEKKSWGGLELMRRTMIFRVMARLASRMPSRLQGWVRGAGDPATP